MNKESIAGTYRQGKKREELSGHVKIFKKPECSRKFHPRHLASLMLKLHKK